MLFNSLSFLIFFPVVVTAYFAVPDKYKNLWLLVASYYFYMSWNAFYALLILFSTATTYLCGILLGKATKKSAVRRLLAVNVAINLAVLFYFKYFGFFLQIISDIFPSVTFTRGLDLPAVVGISFYTFQSLGYTFDVAAKKTKPEKNFLTYALFVSFFPQLVAGPIERSSHLLPQFYQKHVFEYTRVTDGLVLMAWGFFKKMVVADGAARIINGVWEDVTAFSPFRLAVAVLLFAFVIYGDFSGYSDIAVGAAKVMGFDLTRNFNHPYFSKNISEFWRRWHVTLSGWFTDYIYIPLGGSRKGGVRTCLNIMAVFLVSGLWHGASYTFVVWGLINGIYNVIWRLYRRGIKGLNGRKKKSGSLFSSLLCCLVTFAAVDFSWIFFRANNMSDALYVAGKLITSPLALFFRDSRRLEAMGFFAKNGVAVVLCILFMLAVEAWEGKGILTEKINGLRRPLRWAFYYCVISLIMLFGSFGQSRFIYFRF